MNKVQILASNAKACFSRRQVLMQEMDVKSYSHPDFVIGLQEIIRKDLGLESSFVFTRKKLDPRSR